MSLNKVTKEQTYRSTGRKDCHLIPPEELKIVDDPDHPLYDSRIHDPLDEKLVNNIMVCGVKTPITIRLNGKDKKGENIIEVVNGRRRVLHGREANKRLRKQGEEPIVIPCVVEKGEDTDAISTMIVTNEFNVVPSPMNRARKVKALVDRGKTTSEIAVLLNCSESTVYNYLKLLELASEVQKAVDSGKLSVDVAKRLAKLSRDEQREELKLMLESGVTRGRAAIAHAENVANGKPSKPSTIPPARMRPRAVLERFMESIAPTEADEPDEQMDVAGAVVGWVLGNDTALNDYETLQTKVQSLVKSKKAEREARAAASKETKVKKKKGAKVKRSVEVVDL